ncbi:MAG: DUF3991 domain-containing protein [Clostridia bacterium]|nr:DUF3991 domain-containing protein [Clostridia bacterium]
MSNNVGKELKEKAKGVNLIEYLFNHHPELIEEVGRDRFVHPDHDSLVIMERGFFRHSSPDCRGDQIQFLMDFLHMSFQDAVRELCAHAGESGMKLEEHQLSRNAKERFFHLPYPTEDIYKRVWAYLTVKRGIPAEIVQELFDAELLYQSEDYGNCVFHYDGAGNYAEIVGTSDIKFRRNAEGCAPGAYWACGNTDSDTAYVCESAIDAISLMALYRKYLGDNPAFVSIGGLKDISIDKIRSKYKNVIIAVDRDESGDYCYSKHNDLPRILPPDIPGKGGEKLKDWNDVIRFCNDDRKIAKSIEILSDMGMPF